MSSNTSIDGQSIRASVFLYPLGIWIVMAVFAVANGIFRELLLIPRVGEYPGHVISTGLLIVAIVALTYVYFTRSAIDYRETELLIIGVGWTVLTVGFEFLVGHLEGIPVSETLAQYDVFAGQVWIFVPLTLFVTPYLVGRYLADQPEP